jgi:hypothetical protein
VRLRVFNLNEARFECTFGRGCAGICCKNGRPPVSAEETTRIATNLPKLTPLMRPEAVALVAKSGFVSRRRKAGAHTLRVVAGWCVFFNAGCVLHRAGAAEDDKFRYKPFACATFPLERHATRGWYVRQKGLLGEVWDLFCLDPSGSQRSAAASLEEELALIERQASEIRRAGDVTRDTSG